MAESDRYERVNANWTAFEHMRGQRMGHKIEYKYFDKMNTFFANKNLLVFEFLRCSSDELL